MKRKLFGIFLVVSAFSLILVDTHFLYGYYLTAGTTVTIIPLVSIVSIVPLVLGLNVLCSKSEQVEQARKKRDK